MNMFKMNHFSAPQPLLINLVQVTFLDFLKLWERSAFPIISASSFVPHLFLQIGHIYDVNIYVNSMIDFCGIQSKIKGFSVPSWKADYTPTGISDFKVRHDICSLRLERPSQRRSSMPLLLWVLYPRITFSLTRSYNSYKI